MPPTKVILLACGSFNPPTYMHLRMFEIAKDHLHRLGNHVVVGGLISPVHDSYGKKELEASTHRLNMVKLALQSSDWIKLSDWECKQETWYRTKQVLQYHQNQLNALLHPSKNQYNDNVNENDITWATETLRNGIGNSEHVQVKLLCGADLLESFGTPGLWANEDIEAIVGQHGLVVITRSKSNPQEFIYNSDLLTKYMSNITIVTEWITNEVSSTKIRRALRRSESVKYLIPETVMEYIQENALFGFKKSEYLNPFEYNSNYLTPSPSDIAMESLHPSPTNNCLLICNKSLFSQNQINEKHLQIDTPDGISNKSTSGILKHPGQAVKIITERSGDHTIIKNSPSSKEVCREDTKKRTMSISKSCTNFDEADATSNLKHGIGKSNLKECISCDENLIKFIFTKHGIQVISDVETVV